MWGRLSKINSWYIMFPQIFLLIYKNGKLKWLFIPACLILFLYNIAVFLIYLGVFFLYFIAFFIYKNLKNIMKL